MFMKSNLHIVRKSSTTSYYFRSSIPKDLQHLFDNQKEFRLILSTGILSEAKSLAAALHLKSCSLYSQARRHRSPDSIQKIKNDLKSYLYQIRVDSVGKKHFERINRQRTKLVSSYKKMRSKTERKYLAEKNEIQLVKEVVSKLSVHEMEEILHENSCKFSNAPDVTLDSRRSEFLDMWNEWKAIDDLAELFSEVIILNYLHNLDSENFLTLVKEYNLPIEIFETAKHGKEENLEVIFNYLQERYDPIEIALDFGSDYYFKDYEPISQKKEKTNTSYSEAELESAAKAFFINSKNPNRKLELEKQSAPRVTTNTEVAAVKENKTKTFLLSEVIQKFLEERKLTIAEKSLRGYTSCLERFLLIVGEQDMSEISHATMRTFKEIIQKIPTNIKLKDECKNLTLEEIAELGMPPMSITNVNKHITIIGGFFKWSIRQGYGIQTNFAEGFKTPNKKKAKDETDIFTK